MTLDIELIAKWATALIAIISFAKLVVVPFNAVVTGNKKAMQELRDAIAQLSRDLKESQLDRVEIHKTLDRHDERIGHVEDKVIEIDTYCQTRHDRR